LAQITVFVALRGFNTGDGADSIVYRKGHYGVSLVVFAPVGAALFLAGAPELAYVAGVTMLWLAMLPDVDHRLPGVSHRGVTHTLTFALFVGGVLGGAGFALGSQTPLVSPLAAAGYGFAVGVLAVVAHLLGDLLTPMGVPLLWPLSSRRYSLELVRASNGLANYLLFGLGVLVVAATFTLLLRYGAV
jgi:inner membrane protein